MSVSTAQILRATLSPEVQEMGRPRYQHPKPWLSGGVWRMRVRIDARVGPNEFKRIQKTVVLGTVKQIGEGIKAARSAAREYLEKLDDGPKVVQAQASMRTVLEAFERTYIPTLKPGSQRVYRCGIEIIRKRFGKLALYQIDVKAIQEWANELVEQKLRRATVSHRLTIMASVFDRAQAWGYIDQLQRNPCDLVRIGDCTAPRELRSLTPAECRRLLATVSGMEPLIADMVRVALFCGLRIGELLALTWGNYRPPALQVRASMEPKGRVTMPKTSKGVRTVALGPVILKRPGAASDTDFIFPVQPRRARNMMPEILKAAGIEFEGAGWHTLRSTYATLRDGAAGLSVAMGHTDASTTQIYIRPSFDQEAEASKRLLERIMSIDKTEPIQ